MASPETMKLAGLMSDGTPPRSANSCSSAASCRRISFTLTAIFNGQTSFVPAKANYTYMCQVDRMGLALHGHPPIPAPSFPIQLTSAHAPHVNLL
jgi:hypothetical protein